MCILQCLGYCPKSYVRVLTQSNTLTIAREKAAKALKEKGETPEELLQSIKENEAAVAEAQRTVDAWKAIVVEKSRREEASKAEAERIAAEKAEEEARVEAERKAEEERKTEEKERKAKTDGDGQNGFNFFTGTINELIAATRKKGSSLIKKVLSAASNRLIADLKDKGVDISPEYNHTIDNNAINHALNRHSSDKEKEQGQIPLTEKDIENVNDVIDNYDEIKTEKNSRGQDIIIYKKRYTDGTTLYVEEVRTGRKELAMASMRKQRSRKLTDADDLKSTPSSDLPSASADKGSEKPEKKQEKQSVFDKAKEIADKEEKKRKADKPKQKPLTEAERKDAEEVAGALGYRVEWVDTMAENGTIDADKKVIRIANDAENPLVQVLGHEVAHGVKRMDGGKFKALQKAAMEVVGEKEWNERIEKKRKLNAYAEGKLAEEVTCDIVGEALNDKDALKRLAESLRGEKGILARLRDAVAKMVEYFKNRGDKEGVRRMKAADKLLAEFESALKDGDGVNESAREADVPTDNVGNIDFSHRTYHDYKDDDGNEHRGTRGKIIEYLNNAGMKKSDIGKFVDNMDYWYDLTGKVASLVDKDGNFDFPAFHEWSQTSPLYKKYEGNIVRAVSTLVSNGEYPLNFELSTDCIKREAFTQILNEMVDLGGAIWKNLTPAKIQELRTLQQSYGIQVACPLCFVEGKRLNIMKWATGVTDKWNEAVRRVVGDEATPFGFGKGTYVPATPYNERTTPQEVTDQINEVARIVGSREGALPKDLARMQENTKAMEALLQQYYEDYVAKHGSAEGFSLSEAQLGELAKLRGKGASNVVDRMVDMIATHPELQHTLDVSDLVGSKGLMAIRGQSGDGFAKMYSLIVCANGTGTPKIVQDAQPYSGEILDVRQSKFDKAAEIGGARLFSFSDFDLTKTFDIMQIMWDCAARKAKVQSYSKEIPYILMFGKSGVKINMSMLPEARPSEGLVQEYKEAKGSARKYVLEKIRENAGLDMEGGHIVGIQLSDSHSVSKEFAESIYHNPDYNANCGAIMVGISVNHALYAMGQDYIRQVIPFHLSGMPISARRATDCQYYRDFTSEQNTGIIVNGRRVKQFDGGGKPIHNKDVTSDFDFYEGENEKGWDMRQRCRDYVKWCGENGLVPRFEWAVNSDNYKAWCKKKGYQPNQEIVDMMDAHTTDGVYDEYYKVITDFTAYKPIFDKDGNTIGEEPAPHRPVTGDFAMDDKTLGMVLGVDSEGRKVDDNSMLANRENTIKNADANKKEIAEKALLILNGKAKVEDLVRKGGEQFDNNSDSDKFFESSNEGIDRSVRESRSEKTELTAEERELRDNLVERMRKGGLDVVTDSEEMQRVIDTENERTRNMFVGEKGATEADKAEEVSTRLDNLSVARRMEEAEKDAKAIKMATGWERGSDGKWRYETSDIKPKPFEEWMDKKNLKLGDIIDSDSGLFEMYPKLKDFKVTRGKGKSTNAAIYTGLGKIEINFSKFKPYMSIPSNREKIDGILHRVINHEIQHAIQDSEGFAQGVSPNAFSPDAPIGKLREMEEADGRMVERYNAMSDAEKALGEGVRLKERILENRKEYNALASKYRFGMDGYTRAAGEVEARNTEKRIGMTEEERRASLASETEDVAREDQILLGVDNADGEVNAGSVREHRVYHGSGADFDAFDHSHMGEGEGAQAYGWGTYVTEVEGIGRTYAIQNTTKHNDALRALQHDVDAISDQLNRHRDDLKYDEEQLKRANEWRAEAELDYELFRDEAEELKEKYGEASPEYRNHLFNDIYTDEMKRAQSSVKSTEESIQYRKEKIAELEKALKDKQAEIDELPKEFPRHLYTVEIPDDNGSNYLDWNGHPAESLLKGVGSFLESNGFERVQDNPARYEKGESTVVLNPNATGADLYAELQEALGSDKKASQALAELGCIGIKYPADNMRGGRKDGAKNYVIFNENDAKITDHIRFLRTAGGEVYGLVKDGRIYLDPKVATSETAVHEYTHLWGDMLRRKDSEQWSHTVKELKNSVLWEEVKELYPELKTDDEIADEVLSTFSGRRGAERLREEARRVADGDGGVFTKAKAIETLERVKEAIARFWEGVARMFGINRYRSAEELADMAMRDLINGVKPTSRTFTFDNFYKDTKAVFEGTERPKGKPDYTSYSGSEYWYGEDIGGKYVVRGSDHWSGEFKVKDGERTNVGRNHYSEITEDGMLPIGAQGSLKFGWEKGLSKPVGSGISAAIDRRGSGDSNNIASCYWYIDNAKGKDNKGFTYGKAYLSEFEDKERRRDIPGDDWRDIQGLEGGTRAMAVKKANDRFNEELELQVKGELEEGHVYKLGMPSEILLSTGVPNLPIELSAKQLSKKAADRGHRFDVKDIANLPQAIQAPIAVFEYGNKDKSQNLIVEIERDGKKFVVGIHFNQNRRGIVVNDIRGLFNKDSHEWLNWVSQGKLLYADKEKIQALMDKQRTNLAEVNYLNLDDVAKKVKDFENPKLFDGKISEVDKKGSDSTDRSVRENPKNEDKPRFSRKPGESIFDYASRVSEDVDRSVRERVSARDEYEKKVKSKGFQTKEALQNSMLGLQEFMSAIDHASGNKRYIEDIPDFENPILGENRLSSVNKEEMHQVAKTQFKPLMSAVAKLSGNGKESGELYDYMFAKHGLERDAVMRQREAKKEFDKYQKANPKGTKTIGDFVASLEGKDYAGLTALTAEDGRVKSIQSQIDAIDEQMKATDNQLLLHYLGGQKKRLKVDLLNAARDAADDIRKAFENNPSHDRSDINELWTRVNEVNGNTLRKLYESGMLTKEAYNDISSMYTNYIPMRGFDQTTSADAYAYLTHGDSAFNAPIKTAKGRSSKADNPIAYMQAMAESAIMQGNRNVLVKQKMLNFVRNHPSDLASVSDVWLQYDSVADEWKPFYAFGRESNG